jgi:hypothetical protein
MILYCLVGVEILKQRHEFKSIDNEYVTLDSMVPASSVNDAEAMTIEVNVPSQAVHFANFRDMKEAEFSTFSKSNSPIRPSDSVALTHRGPKRSPVSFRKYVLMPLMFFVVLLAVWVAPTTNRVSAFIHPDHASYPLLLAVGSMGSLRGFWNGVVFITIGMRARMRQKKLRRRRG